MSALFHSFLLWSVIQAASSDDVDAFSGAAPLGSFHSESVVNTMGWLFHPQNTMCVWILRLSAGSEG